MFLEFFLILTLEFETNQLDLILYLRLDIKSEKKCSVKQRKKDIAGI